MERDEATQTRRVFVRFESRFPARYAIILGDRKPAGDEQHGHTLNLSAGGCMLVAGQHVPSPMTRVRVQIRLPSGIWVRLNGVVRWSEPAKRAGEPSSMGVSFTEPVLPGALRTYLDECQRKKTSL